MSVKTEKGTIVPSFYIRSFMELVPVLKELVLQHLPGEHYFLVDIKITATSGPKKVIVLIDGDQGVTIDDCAHLSRSVSEEIERKDLIEGAYTLEVSSPGLDQPLSMLRQYQKNIGRKLNVVLEDDSIINGELKSVTADAIRLVAERKEGKKMITQEKEVSFSNIKKAIVLVSFN